MFTRLNSMRLTLSTSTMARRLESLAKLHDTKVSKWKDSVASRASNIQTMKAKISELEKALDHHESVNPSSSTAAPEHIGTNTLPEPNQVERDQQELNNELTRTLDNLNQLIDEDHGVNFVIDNIDIRQNVSNMTEENQNLDCHWVNASVVFNRISGNHLPDDKCTKDVMQVDNMEVLPSIGDNLAYRRNIKVHIQRVLVKRLPCLQHLSDSVLQHIPHTYMNEMKEKPSKVQYHTMIIKIHNNHNIYIFIYTVM